MRWLTLAIVFIVTNQKLVSHGFFKEGSIVCRLENQVTGKNSFIFLICTHVCFRLKLREAPRQKHKEHS